jgi:two-component system phosphate regulon sensor histidine kinase PhoR
MVPLLLLIIVLLSGVSAVLGVAAHRRYEALRAAHERGGYLGGELRRVEGEALRLETVRRDFVANISHELRTPLASIKLLVETLEAGALDDYEVALEFTGRIGEETDHLIGMVEELLDLARLEAAPAIHPCALDPGDVVSRVVERMRQIARTKGVALRVELAPDLPAMWADDEQVGRVFVNLLNNAITFTPEGGAVVVRAVAEGVDILFSVADTGPGIPSGEEDRIFERFYKVDTARRRGGTGLGLSIARHIVQAQGGRIWARNREDHGALFAFTIPLASASVPRPEAALR